MAAVERVHLGPLHGYSVRFSPFCHGRLACAASQYFGIAGCGELIIVEQAPQGGWAITRRLEWPDGLFDIAWSEEHENQIVSVSGDGSAHLWDLGLAATGPVCVFKEHTKEIYNVEWGQVRGDNFFATASWDNTVKIWDPTNPRSLRTLAEHAGMVYCAVWSPHDSGVLASASSDGTVKVWDSRSAASVQTIRAHDGEVLTCDWNKYEHGVLVTGGVDRLIRGFDIRDPHRPLFTLAGHRYGVRRVRCSPHDAAVAASVSYDFSMRTWNVAPQQSRPLEVFQDHTEFTIGLDFSLHVPGLVADCSWDETIAFRRLGGGPHLA